MRYLMSTYRPPEVRFVSGSGSRLVDDTGKSYLDFLSGIAVTSLGHAHPAVGDAICGQARTLLHVSNLFGNTLNEAVAQLIDRLVGDGAQAGGKVFFANSGAEANECAIKLVRRVAGPGRFAIVTAVGSFHGRTFGAMAATGQAAKKDAYAPLLQGFIHVPFGDAGALRKTLEDESVGAVLLEPIAGEFGVIPAPSGYLREVRSICDEFGVLLVCDEIQTGLARTARWFAFQREEILPDVVTMAKALGNGVPAGACWAKAEVAAAFQPGDHGSTFGGQPLAMSAVKATLETMVAIDAPRLAKERGEHLKARIAALAGVSSVRGAGLLIGVVLEEGIDSKAVEHEALEVGLVVNTPVPGVIRLAPPLTVSEDECDEGARLLRESIERARGEHRSSDEESA